jgi:hypothetical protein
MAEKTETEKLADVIVTVLKAALTPLKERVAALEQRDVAAACHWAGVFNDAETYTAGALATHSGALWIALVKVKGVRPGGGDGCWKLVAKSGTDVHVQEALLKLDRRVRQLEQSR